MSVMDDDLDRTDDPTDGLVDGLADPDLQAMRFGRVRAAHQSEMAEDYVELIADLIDARGEARVSDLAARFGVSHATVNKIIARLNREGLVTNRPYRALFLTDEGRALADACRERHRIVVAFLTALGLPVDIAEMDAEGIEHHVSAETLDAFARFAEGVYKKP